MEHPPSILYRQALGKHASVLVTRCNAARSEPYQGNLALHVQDDAPQVMARRAALEATLGAPVQWLNQVHGTQLVECSGVKAIATAPTADASLTQSPDVALGILTADCLPVVIAAADGSAVAAAHAGWRGLQAGILNVTWAALRAKTARSAIVAHLGPCIGQAQFEVGSEVFDAFVSENRALAKYFAAAKPGKFLADLCGIAREQLRALGAPEVTGGGWCTVSDPRLASYRRSDRLNQPSGRFATVAMLRPLS
jgi:polyphenol oxidase